MIYWLNLCQFGQMLKVRKDFAGCHNRHVGNPEPISLKKRY